MLHRVTTPRVITTAAVMLSDSAPQETTLMHLSSHNYHFKSFSFDLNDFHTNIWIFRYKTATFFSYAPHSGEEECVDSKGQLRISFSLKTQRVVYYATDQKIFSSHKKTTQTEAKRVCTARRIFIF